MKRFVSILGISICAFLAGCTQAGLMERFTPPSADSAARDYVDLLRQRKFDQIEYDLDPSVVKADDLNTLAQMAALFPDEIVKSAKVVGVDVSRGQDSSTTKITLEYEFPSRWLLASVTTQKRGNVSTLESIDVYTMSDSLENLNKFTLGGKAFFQYFNLTCTVACLLFNVYVFVLCIRSKKVKRRWLWAVITLVGVVKLGANWVTGEAIFIPVSIQLPCFWATRPLYGPWSIGWSIPVGAFAFLIKRRRVTATPVLAPPSAQPPEEETSSAR